MQNRIVRFVLRGACAAALCGITVRAQAATNAVASGDWSLPGTWSAGVPSANPANQALIDGGFTVDVTTAGQTASYTDIGTAAGQTGSLTVSAGGDLTISNPTNAAPNIPSLRIGQAAGSSGTVTMTGGSISIPGNFNTGIAIGDLLVGDVGTGRLIISGGSLTSGDEMFIGLANTAVGQVDISGGTLSATGRSILVCLDGAASLNVSGTGFVRANFDMFVGFGATSSAVLTLAGSGTIESGFMFTNRFGGNSTLTQTGGFNDLRLALVIGTEGTGLSTYSHSAGTINVRTSAGIGDMVVGDGSNGIYNINSTASAVVGRDFIVGARVAGRGTVNMSGGSISAAGYRIGQQGLGTFNLSGGTLIQTNVGTRSEDNLLVGRDNSTGTLNQTGGTASIARNVFLGDFDNSIGNYKIAGGTLSVSGNFSVGAALASNAPADGVRTGDQGQALNANGVLTISGSASDISITGNFLANPADKTRLGAANSATLVFELFNSSGSSLIDIAGNGDIDGALIDMVLMGGYVPAFGQTFDLATATQFGSTGTGTTQTTGTGEGFTQALDDIGVFTVAVIPGGRGELLRATYIPEPDGLPLLLLAAAGSAIARRRSCVALPSRVSQ